MKSEHFSEALENISEPYIDNAARAYDTAAKKRRRSRRIFRAACAAVLALALLTGAFGLLGQEDEFVAVPGVLRVYAYDLKNADGADVSEVEKYALEEGVVFVDGFWGPLMGNSQGIPITFMATEESIKDATITFDLTLNYGELAVNCGEQSGFDLENSGKQCIVENGRTVYWTGNELLGIYADYAPNVQDLSEFDEMLIGLGEVYMDVVMKADGHIVGCAVIQFVCTEELGAEFSAKLVKTLFYPPVNGEFQEISEAYVQKMLVEFKAS